MKLGPNYAVQRSLGRRALCGRSSDHDLVINERISITTGTDRQTPPAVSAAVVATPATASAKKAIAQIAIPAVRLMANVRPRLLASISASASLELLASGPWMASSAIAIIRSADPGTTLSYAASSEAGGRGAFQEYPTTSRLA